VLGLWPSAEADAEGVALDVDAVAAAGALGTLLHVRGALDASRPGPGMLLHGNGGADLGVDLLCLSAGRRLGRLFIWGGPRGGLGSRVSPVDVHRGCRATVSHLETVALAERCSTMRAQAVTARQPIHLQTAIGFKDLKILAQ
jgi:hypothetical protein